MSTRRSCPNCLMPLLGEEGHCPNCGHKIRSEIAPVAKAALKAAESVILWIGGAVIAVVGVAGALILGILGSCMFGDFSGSNFGSLLGGFALIVLAGAVLILALYLAGKVWKK